MLKLGDRLLSMVLPRVTADAQPPPGCWCEWCTSSLAQHCCDLGGGQTVCTQECLEC